MENSNNYGIVYVLVNPVMPGLVKIGMTTRDNIETRMKELYGTGVPVPFECRYACKVKASDCRDIEQALHEAFSSHRINANREFFRIEPEQVMAILKLFNEGDITKEITHEMDEELTPDDKIAQEKAKRARRPSLNYKEMGIEPGTVLSYTKAPQIQVTVVNEKKVSFQGEELSLSAVTKKILGIEHDIQPTGYWTVEGKNLKDIYEDTYILTEEN